MRLVRAENEHVLPGAAPAVQFDGFFRRMAGFRVGRRRRVQTDGRRGDGIGLKSGLQELGSEVRDIVRPAEGGFQIMPPAGQATLAQLLAEALQAVGSWQIGGIVPDGAHQQVDGFGHWMEGDQQAGELFGEDIEAGSDDARTVRHRRIGNSADQFRLHVLTVHEAAGQELFIFVIYKNEVMEFISQGAFRQGLPELVQRLRRDPGAFHIRDHAADIFDKSLALDRALIVFQLFAAGQDGAADGHGLALGVDARALVAACLRENALAKSQRGDDVHVKKAADVQCADQGALCRQCILLRHEHDDRHALRSRVARQFGRLCPGLRFRAGIQMEHGVSSQKVFPRRRFTARSSASWMRGLFLCSDP